MTKAHIYISTILACFVFQKAVVQAQNNSYIERLDAKMDSFVDVQTQVEVLAQGFKWSEGPVWVEELDALLFSDVPNNTVYSWSEKNGLQVFLSPSGYTGITPSTKKSGSNGLTLDLSGKLVLCMQGDRRIAKLDNWNNTHVSTVVTRFDGKLLNSPNDLVYAQNGDLYFTDPPYGLKGSDDPLRELAVNGVYKYSSAGKLTLIIDDLTAPNGIAISNNQKTLYVTVSDRSYPRIMAYDITPTGVINPRVFFDGTALMSKGKGNFDGLKIHPTGVIFSTGPGGVLVFTPEGKHLGTIHTGHRTANCAFDSEYKYLYMTTHKILTRVKLN
jgi:gluconolactonase